MSAASAARASAQVLPRRALLLVVAAGAVTALFAGLARVGVSFAWGPPFAMQHGPLFVLGVFGTVIGLERAVALGRGWGYTAPALGAGAGVAMLAGLFWAPWAAVASGLALVALNTAIVRRQAANFTWLMLLGSGVLVLGELAWAASSPVYQVVPAWFGFFVLTIVAERLELSRLAQTPPWAGRVLVVLSALFALAAGLCAFGVTWAPRAAGASMALLALWQLRFDLARRTVRGRGLPRFAALGVLLGAGWLLVSGALLAGLGLPPAGPLYDAVLHAVFVGYVLSMVFAHAPIILPAVARVEVPWTPFFFLPLATLHLGLVCRVAGDLVGSVALRQAGSISNAVAPVLFGLVVLGARAWRLRRAPASRPLTAVTRT